MGNIPTALYQVAKTFLHCSRICSNPSMGMHLTVKEKLNLKKELILHKEQLMYLPRALMCCVTAQTSFSSPGWLLKLRFLQFENRSLGGQRYTRDVTKILSPVNISWNKHSSQEVLKGDVLWRMSSEEWGGKWLFKFNTVTMIPMFSPTIMEKHWLIIWVSYPVC